MGLLDDPVAYVRDMLEGDVAGMVLVSVVQDGCDRPVLESGHPAQRDVDTDVGIFASDPGKKLAGLKRAVPLGAGVRAGRVPQSADVDLGVVLWPFVAATVQRASQRW